MHVLVSALEAFVAAAKQLPREGAHDVVEGYVTISVECAELFQLLSGERPPESEVRLLTPVQLLSSPLEGEGCTPPLQRGAWPVLGSRSLSRHDLRKHLGEARAACG